MANSVFLNNLGTAASIGGTPQTGVGLTLAGSGSQLMFAPPDNNGTTWMQIFKGNNGTVTGGFDARGNLHTNLAVFISGGWAMTLNADGSVASVTSATTGLSCMLDIVGDTTYGVVSKGSSTPGHLFTGLDQNANFVFNVDPTGNLQFGVGATIGSVDTNLSRVAAGVLAVGTGAAGNTTGTFQGLWKNNAATITSTAATTATFLTNGVGGAGGPTTGAQNGWIVMKDSAGASIWVPVWK